MSIGKMLNIGKGALAANQLALATTSHNVANASTPGYSRQRVNMTTETPTNYGQHRLGSGVNIASIARVESTFVNRRIEEESSGLGRAEGTAEVLQQVETLFKDDAEHGLSKSVTQFFNDVRTLSTQPESISLRAAVRESANAVTARFRTVSEGVDDVVQDLNRRVEGGITQVNFLTAKVADLNKRIVEIEVRGSGANANDERDQRDMAVQELSKLVPVQITETENGGINVNAGRMGVLVNASDAFALTTARAEDSIHPGAVHIYTQNALGGISKDVTEGIEGGSVGGFLSVRDKMIPALMNKVDTLAFNLAGSVNGVHEGAYSNVGQSGVPFFTNPGSVKGAASSFNLSPQVVDDLNSISAGMTPNAPGDNRALLALADLQDAKIFEGGKANFVDYTAGIVGDLGVEIRASNDNLEVQQGLVDQLHAAREQTSGVSLDEEAINMIKYQKAFDASAKMIQAADQMLDTILNLKRF